MNNEYLSRLIRDLNYEFVKRFDKEKLKELAFVPAASQNNSVYTVISYDTNKDAVSQYVKEVTGVEKTEFITIQQSQFESLIRVVIKRAFEESFQSNKTSDSENKFLQSQQDKGPRKKLGEILVEDGILQQEQVEAALTESKKVGLPLGSTLVKMGYLTIVQLKEALAKQMQVKFVSDEQLASLPESVPWLSDDFVREHKVVPLNLDSKSLTIGMVNPNDTKTINEIMAMTGMVPSVLMITSIEFERFLEHYYAAYQQKSAVAHSLESLTEQIATSSSEVEEPKQEDLWERVQTDIDDINSDAARYANTMLTQAIGLRASDIHIEPRQEGYIARFRIDGTLVEVVKIPHNLESNLISRLKVIAKMNIAEHRRPQDGNFSIKYNNKTYDLRINTLPANGREKIVIRILQPTTKASESYAEEIKIPGAYPDDLEKIKYLISSPNGIVLTVGPTGSGKTTTLYSLLKTINTPEVNICTIEDPVEIRLDGLNQSAINDKAGITFANFMRAVLRQDPDVILVGEIRDYETLETAISAALTGHFVLSTIHTNSAAATITRLTEMGAKDYLISSSLNGVIAQRLVKLLCPKCKEAYRAKEEEVRKITRDPEVMKQLLNTDLYRPKGCPNCNNSGYKGRLALLEILTVTKEIKLLIAQKAHDIEIEDYAIKNCGMHTLKDSCIRHILDGHTSIKEFVRVLGLVGE